MTAAVTAPPASWALVERAKAGDMAAFAELYRIYRPEIGGFIYIHTRDRDLTNDLTADVFAKALKNIGRVRWQGVDISAWLHTIAKNTIADHWKKHRTWRETSVGQPWDEDAAVAGAEETVLARVDLVAAVRRLRDDQRECVILRLLNDVSVEDTARLMGRSEGAVKALLHRAVRALARDEALAGAA